METCSLRSLTIISNVFFDHLICDKRHHIYEGCCCFRLYLDHFLYQCFLNISFRIYKGHLFCFPLIWRLIMVLIYFILNAFSCWLERFLLCLFVCFQTESLCSSGCPWTHYHVSQAGFNSRSSYLSLPSTKSTGICHHAQLKIVFSTLE